MMQEREGLVIPPLPEQRPGNEVGSFPRKGLGEMLSFVSLLTGTIQGLHTTREKVRRQRRNRGCYR